VKFNSGRVTGLNGEVVFSKEIDEYFSSKGFCTSTLNPKFADGFCYCSLTLGKVVMHKGIAVREGYTTRIFLSTTELYVEKENPDNTYDSSRFSRFSEPLTSIEDTEEAIRVLMAVGDIMDV
jgi:hypothetical protein